MRTVSILGVGLTPVAEHWEEDLRHLGYYALRDALRDARLDRADALFVGNMLSGELSRQEQVGALLADFSGLRRIEAVRVEAAGASGAAAVRMAYLAVASGALDVALVVGVEKLTDQVGPPVISAQATALDQDFEGVQGLTPAAVAALLMRRYMHEYNAALADFAPFSVQAHANAATSAHALYRNKLTPDGFLKAPPVAPPVSLFDQAPLGDGAAALVLAAAELAPDPHRAVRIAASAAATDTVAIHDRRDLLFFEAAYAAAVKAYEMAGIGPSDIDALELHDAFTVYAALTLEACGFARRGQALELARSGALGLMGAVPLSTFGGLKARGDVGGATGVYQVAELVHQLRGDAGANQVPNARWGMSVGLGGAAATAIVHLLRAPEG